MPASDDDKLIDLAVRMPRDTLAKILPESRLPDGDTAARAAALAKWLLKVHHRRDRILPSFKIGEPTWAMVLDLFVATQEGRRLDVSSFYLASGLAVSTAARYVEILADAGHITRRRDPKDGRRTFVSLSPTLRTAIQSWLERAVTDLLSVGWPASPTPTGDRRPA